MNPEKPKSRRTGSAVAKGLIKAAAYKKMAMAADRCGQPDYSGHYEDEQAKLLYTANQPLSELEHSGIGAAGEMILNMPMAPGDHSGMQLRNTVKDPDMITASAQLDRLRLAEEAGALDIALDATDTIEPRNSMEKMLSHQLSALHVLAMRMAGTAGVWLDKATPNEYTAIAKSQIAHTEAARAATAAAKMMQSYQQGMITLQRIRCGGKQQMTVVHQHVQVAGGQVAVTGAMMQVGGVHGGESGK